VQRGRARVICRCGTDRSRRSLGDGLRSAGTQRAPSVSGSTQASCMQLKFRTGVLLAAIAVAGGGCGWMRASASRSAGSAPSTVSQGQQPGQALPTSVQAQVMRFADGYAARVAEATEDFRARVPTPEARLAALKWKLAQATAAYINGSGAKPVVGALDMVTLASLSRMVVEEHWVGQEYGESARPLLEAHRQLETEAWALVRTMLKPEQEQQLRELIATWRAAHPGQVQVHQVHLVDFVAYAGNQPSEQASRPTGLLGILRIDPLAGLDPTVRAIEETRLLAERTTYYLQHMPMLLNWHAELLSYQLAVTPESQQLLGDAARLTESVEVFARTAEQLPQLVNDQREAAINQIFAGFSANERKLRASLVELRSSLQAGTELAKSTDAAVQSLDRFVARFDKGPPAPGAPRRRPFDILDYATTARELSGTIKELNATLSSLDQTMPQIEKAAGALEEAGNRLLVRVLVVGAALIVLLLGGGLAAALAYRRFARPSVRDA